ncbi:MAG: hypothetical protein BGP16_13485 [Sphingobium sp. 66-54]|nr:MAG: hypothetical protein BGP16_13485 [Sphingobium sp. 66-54]
MKKTLYAAAAALGVVAMAPAASATDLSIALVQSGDSYTADYGNAGLANAFSDTITFTPAIADALADITLIQAGTGLSAITFSELTLDGIDLLPSLTAIPGSNVLVLTGYALAAGEHVLTVGGTAGGNASYSGTVNFALGAAVPEPATWAMMVVGVAAIGMTLRRRSHVTRIAFS